MLLSGRCWDAVAGVMPNKKLTIASRTSEAGKVHEAVLPELIAHGFGPDARFAVRLALDEALANAICHGNQQDPQTHVVVEYSIADDRVTISVKDQGAGFSPSQVPDPTLDENLEKLYGRGIMLMRAYMSDVLFNDRGNCVTLIKNRHCMRPRGLSGRYEPPRPLCPR